MSRLTRTLAVLLLGASALSAAEPPPDQLTDAEKAAGWRLLFDGRSLAGWQVAGKNTPPTQGWVVEDGILKKQQGVRGGDLLSVEAFDDFEFAWTWRLPGNGNNGVKFFVVPERGIVGHEYQMYDEKRGGEGKGSTGSFYDVLPPNPGRLPFTTAEWNHSRVLVQGNHVEHWLNGQKILEYELGSPEVLAAVQNSKFRNTRDFGKKVKGHILLTDHGDAAWFKDVKIREIR
ncbi:MAG: DUF1080 domain-containing protein [Verrucomicrobiales bacterium]|nr:DUF1080 domain-containing protein [Verrucomicrobiales bacterium]